jgi:hypothetical protein
VPSHDEVLAFVRELARKLARPAMPAMEPEEERMANV